MILPDPFPASGVHVASLEYAVRVKVNLMTSNLERYYSRCACRLSDRGSRPRLLTILVTQPSSATPPISPMIGDPSFSIHHPLWEL